AILPLARAWLAAPRAALQVLLHDDVQEIQRILDGIGAFQADVVYIDTVRLLPLMRAIRARHPKMRIVLDADDLFSLRYRNFAEGNEALNLGYLASHLTPRVAEWLSRHAPSRLIYWREAKNLWAAEKEAADLADAVVLVSSSEANTLAARTQTAVHVLIPPPPVVRAPPAPALPPFEFVFVGTDRLQQNVAAIACLLNMWRRHALSRQLTIYGQMTRNWESPRHVRFAGFADDLSVAYTPHAILTVPSFTKGGVKTKVIEAFGYGAPVMGTPVAFSGIVDGYPLSFASTDAMADCIAQIDDRLEMVRTAQRIAHDFAIAHDFEAYERGWDAVFGATGRAGQPTAVMLSSRS
ncbi:MAG: glycosyltransferase, partial [Alphaproteobacteria bacterium]